RGGGTGETAPGAPAARAETDFAPPGLPRFDWLESHSKRATRFRGGPLASGLRKSRRPPAGRSPLRRALGPPLDGRLALQRLGGLERRQSNPRQPASYLAMARLDH